MQGPDDQRREAAVVSMRIEGAESSLRELGRAAGGEELVQEKLRPDSLMTPWSETPHLRAGRALRALWPVLGVRRPAEWSPATPRPRVSPCGPCSSISSVSNSFFMNGWGQERPLVAVNDVRAVTGTSFAAASQLAARVEALDILREVTGHGGTRRVSDAPFIAFIGDS